MAYEAVTTTEYRTKTGERRGTRALLDVLLFLFGALGVTDLGIYNRRKVRGGSSWSIHAVGRAFDLGIPNKALGDRIFLLLIRAAPKLGLCEIIWWGQRWTAENGVQPYYGVDNHHTHIHGAQTQEAADNPSKRDDLTKWYATAILNG